MIDIVGHFFVLYPLITLNKESQIIGKSNRLKLVANLAILAAAAILTNVYLMDSQLVQSSRREENLYEIFEILPQEFLKFNSTTLKRRYRDLSRKYHPDKNTEYDNTDKFMKLKTAYEILNDPERRRNYDVYGTLDFGQDDTMKNMMEVRFKNETEREQQWKTYQTAKNNMKVFGEVAPYYITWFLLACYRVDRASSYNILLFLILLVAAIEMQARLKYGTGSFDFFFELMFTYFPSNFTIGENMQLTRQLFPLVFQLVLVFCDCTIDAPKVLTEEEEQEQKAISTKYTEFAKRQQVVIDKMKISLEGEEAPKEEEFDDIYEAVRTLDSEGYQEVMHLRMLEVKQQQKGWSFLGIFRSLIGIVMALSVFKMVLFPQQEASEAEKMANFQITLNDTEYMQVQSMHSDQEKSEAYKAIWKRHYSVHEAEMKKQAVADEERVKRYFEDRGQGHASTTDILWSMKEDFYVFAEKRGGVWVQMADKVKQRADEWERLHPKKNETEEAEAKAALSAEDADDDDESSPEAKAKEDDDLDDFEIEQKEKEVKEVPQEVLDAIFGKDDDEGDDDEDEREEDDDVNDTSEQSTTREDDEDEQDSDLTPDDELEVEGAKKGSKSETNESQDQEPPEKAHEDTQEPPSGGTSEEIGKHPDSGLEEAAGDGQNHKETKDEL